MDPEMIFANTGSLCLGWTPWADWLLGLVVCSMLTEEEDSAGGGGGDGDLLTRLLSCDGEVLVVLLVFSCV